MATTTKTKTDSAGRVIETRSTPASTYDPAYDSYLITHQNGADNFTLTLVLKLYLNQINTGTMTLPFIGKVNVPLFRDFDKTLFVIKPWTPSDYAKFTQEFKKHAAHWNDKFWLTPPAGFTGYDYKIGTKTFRPNVYCHLYIDLVSSPADAHLSIDIVNLDKSAAARQLGKKPSEVNASDFRSDSGTYDSADTKPVPLGFTDNTGTKHNNLNRSTIAHEIGHALGLPHAGVSQGAPLCGIAVLADNVLDKATKDSASYPALLRGGSNSQACYGHHGPFSVGSNVMGYGLSFDATNAQPWVDRIAFHTGTKASDWGVSVYKKVTPKPL